MNYYSSLKEFELRNLYAQLGESPNPILARVDINVPVKKDSRKISRNPYNLRLEYYAYELDLYSTFAPVVVMAHQGRNDGKDINFVDLNNHIHALGVLTNNANILYEPGVKGENYFGKRLIKRIKSLDVGDVLVLKNVREFDFETKFDPNNCPYIPFFKKAGIEACINNGLPLYHRAHSSVMALPHIAPTYIGLISAKELEIQHKILHDDGKKIVIMGGKKPKAKTVPNLAKSMDIMVGGLTGQIFCRLKGFDLGPKNNQEVEKQLSSYKPEEINMLKEVVRKYEIITPIDFVVSFNGEIKEVSIDDLPGKPYYIEDIGPQTVDLQVSKIREGGYDWIIRGGPEGRYEAEHYNGIKVVRKILGRGFVALGGDTIEELQTAKLCKPIVATGGQMLLGGGAHLSGWAGEPYPSLDEILKIQTTNVGR